MEKEIDKLEERPIDKQFDASDYTFVTKSMFVYVVIYAIAITIYIIILMKTASISYWDSLTRPSWALEYKTWIFINILTHTAYMYASYKLSEMSDAFTSAINISMVAVYFICLIIHAYMFSSMHSVFHQVFYMSTIGAVIIQAYLASTVMEKSKIPLIIFIALLLLMLYNVVLFYKLWSDNV